ncbi:MAG TPA: cytochrome c [Armatimonadota bacterium]|nr:cytochrome c [Armatimonadota bacterium]
MKSWTLLAAAIACLMLAVIVFVVGSAMVARRAGPGGMMGPGMMGPQGGSPPPADAQYESNGERIYLIATNDEGERISFTGGPPWLAMHGGSCVNCHGRDGKGGVPIMSSRQLAPDIRYDVLTGKEHPAVEHEEGAHEHYAYTDAAIKRAITQGVEPDGKELDLLMPRWQMSERDLSDLIAYLKHLDGHK